MINWLLENKYFMSIAILLLFYIVSELVVLVSQKVLLRITRKTKTIVDDLIVKRTNKPISFILLLIGIKLAAIPLELGEKLGFIISKVSSSFIMVLVFYIIIVVLDILLDNWGKSWAAKTKSTLDDHLLSILHKFSKVLFAILGLLFVLDLWGIKIGALLASLGIAGLAVAFALQSTLGNIFGGISLILDKNIKVGDVIALDAETMGTVMDIGLRSTRIKTFDNEVIIIPNGELASKRLQNIAQPDPSARVVIPFGVAYSSDVDKVKRIVIKEIEKIEGLKKDSEPSVRFVEMGDSALLFKAYFWMQKYNERFGAKDQANTLIYNALNKNKINIPFPQVDVWLKRR